LITNIPHLLWEHYSLYNLFLFFMSAITFVIGQTHDPNVAYHGVMVANDDVSHCALKHEIASLKDPINIPSIKHIGYDFTS
jgi:hypothetical protein